MRTSRKGLTGYKYKTYTANDGSPESFSIPKNQISSILSTKRWYLKPGKGYKKRRPCNRKDVLIHKPVKKLLKSDCNLDKCIGSFKHKRKRTCFTVGKNSKDLSGNAGKESVRRRKLKRKNAKVEQDEVIRMQRKAKYLLIKMKLEQNLIDAYSGDGWKGQSREKIKPEKELQRARRQIIKCKLGIRDSIHHLDLLGSDGRIEDSVMHPDGSVFHEYIFCAKCKSREAFPNNDIILCDGNCNCGFHQRCLDPPLARIPPGDQGWLCRICSCKLDILETINAHLGTRFTVNNSWEEIFKEAAVTPGTEGVCPNLVEDWPSDDSEDEDYCPDSANNIAEFDENFLQGACTSSDSIFTIDASLNIVGLGSDESNDEITDYRRQRRDVDYKKLYCEMFGKEPNEHEEQSEDEDWGPYRKKKTRNTSNVGFSSAAGEDRDINEKMTLQAKLSCNKRSFFSIPPAIEDLFVMHEHAKVTNHPPDGSDISIVNEGHKHIGDSVSSDSSWLLPLASIFHSARHKKRMHRRENFTSATSPVKIQKRTQVPSSAIQVKSVGHHPSGKVAPVVPDPERPFESEMQMLWALERRLHRLKQQLLACKDDNAAQVRDVLGGGDVVYVPVAEVVEKATCSGRKSL